MMAVTISSKHPSNSGSLAAHVVYKFNCSRDADLSYIGKTKRHLVTRVREHSKSASAVCEHLEGCDACKSEYSVEKNFKILDKGRMILKLL